MRLPFFRVPLNAAGDLYGIRFVYSQSKLAFPAEFPFSDPISLCSTSSYARKLGGTKDAVILRRLSDFISHAYFERVTRADFPDRCTELASKPRSLVQMMEQFTGQIIFGCIPLK
jgi:hypothetical protein